MIEYKFYLIKHVTTGLLSRGGQGAIYKSSNDDNYYYFSKKGKVWNDAGDIRRHLCQFLPKHYNSDIPADWNVLVVSTVHGVKEYPAKEFYHNKNIENAEQETA